MTSNGRGPDQPPARGRSPLRIRVGIVALVVLGILGLVWAALSGSDDDVEVSVNAAGPVSRLIPGADDEVLQQQRVGVVLDVRYRLTSLVVYPSDQTSGGIDVTVEVDHIEGLNQFEFAPGEGRLIQALSPDTNCAVANYALIARPDETGNVRWCFEVS